MSYFAKSVYSFPLNNTIIGSEPCLQYCHGGIKRCVMRVRFLRQDNRNVQQA